jgi:hypothetical protein
MSQYTFFGEEPIGLILYIPFSRLGKKSFILLQSRLGTILIRFTPFPTRISVFDIYAVRDPVYVRILRVFPERV